MVKLDNVDRGILHELQVDARNRTAQEIADKVDVSASTVRNRIEQLERDGVIEGYHPKIDYETADLPLQVLFVCTATPKERAAMVDQVLDVRGVVDVRETLTGHRNLYVEAVGTGTADTARITDALHEAGLTVQSSEILRQRRVQPFNHFFFTDPYDDGGEDAASADDEDAVSDGGRDATSETTERSPDDAADRSARDGGGDGDGEAED